MDTKNRVHNLSAIHSKNIVHIVGGGDKLELAGNYTIISGFSILT